LPFLTPGFFKLAASKSLWCYSAASAAFKAAASAHFSLFLLENAIRYGREHEAKTDQQAYSDADKRTIRGVVGRHLDSPFELYVY
jgi:hypothetical protein